MSESKSVSYVASRLADKYPYTSMRLSPIDGAEVGVGGERSGRGVNVTRWAAEIGVGREYLSGVVNGRIKPGWRMVMRMAASVGVGVEEMAEWLGGA